jgi:O-antigen/teichoic acid export membrane protein
VIALHGAQYLLGERYRDIAPQAAALCVLPVMFCISEVTMIGLMVKRRATMALSATAVGLATSALANIVLTIPLSGTGACMALTLAAFAFLSARTEFAARVWQPIRRRKVYFGATLITTAGLVAPLFPSAAGPIPLLILLPFFLRERDEVVFLLKHAARIALARGE